MSAFTFQIPPQEYPHAYQDRLKIMEAKRRETQVEHDNAYQKALVEIKEELREKEGDDMIESMKNEIREWFHAEK
jgi:hypothetical protein